MVLSKGASWCTASTRSTPALRSAVASSLPTSRSPYRIGSAKYPQRRLAAGLYIRSGEGRGGEEGRFPGGAAHLKKNKKRHKTETSGAVEARNTQTHNYSHRKT